MKTYPTVLLCIACISGTMLLVVPPKPQTTVASFYASNKMECASRDYPVGTVLRVTHTGAMRFPSTTAIFHESILVPVTSRGPFLQKYANGRHLDLSAPAFEQLADPKQGLIEVTIEKVN